MNFPSVSRFWNKLTYLLPHSGSPSPTHTVGLIEGSDSRVQSEYGSSSSGIFKRHELHKDGLKMGSNARLSNPLIEAVSSISTDRSKLFDSDMHVKNMSSGQESQTRAEVMTRLRYSLNTCPVPRWAWVFAEIPSCSESDIESDGDVSEISRGEEIKRKGPAPIQRHVLREGDGIIDRERKISLVSSTEADFQDQEDVGELNVKGRKDKYQSRHVGAVGGLMGRRYSDDEKKACVDGVEKKREFGSRRKRGIIGQMVGKDT